MNVNQGFGKCFIFTFGGLINLKIDEKEGY